MTDTAPGPPVLESGHLGQWTVDYWPEYVTVSPVVSSLPRPPSGVAHLFLNVLGSEVLRYTVGARHLRVSWALLCHAPVRRTRAASARYTGELPRRPRSRHCRCLSRAGRLDAAGPLWPLATMAAPNYASRGARGRPACF